MNETTEKLKKIKAKFLLDKQAAIRELVALEGSNKLSPEARKDFFKKNPEIWKYFIEEYPKEKSIKSSEAMTIVSNVTEAKFYSIPAKVNLAHLESNGKLLSDKQIEEIKALGNKDNRKIGKRAMPSSQKYNYSVLHAEKKDYAMYYGQKWNKHLGAGGFGKVKLMQDFDGEYFGAKVQKPKNGKVFTDTELAQIQQEINNLKKVDQFECVVIREAVVDENRQVIEPAQVIIGMKLGKGPAWGDEPLPQMPMTRALLQFRHFLFAIKSQVKDKGIIHRDIKPANVLFHEDTDTFTVVDWGLAITKEDAGKNKYGWVGTPSYNAPEITGAERGKVEYSDESDVYAAAVSLARKANLCVNEYDVSLLDLTGQALLPDMRILNEQHSKWPILVKHNEDFYYYSRDKKDNLYCQPLESNDYLKRCFKGKLNAITLSKVKNNHIFNQIIKCKNETRNCFLSAPRAKILEFNQSRGNKVLPDDGLRAAVIDQLKLMMHEDKNQRPSLENCIAFFDSLLEMSPQVLAKTRRIAFFDVNEYQHADESQKAILIKALKNVDEVWVLDVGNPPNIQDQKQFNELQRALENASIPFSGRLFNAPGAKLEDAARGMIAKTKEDYHDKWVGFFLVEKGEKRLISSNVALAQVMHMIHSEINRLSERKDNKIIVERLQLLKDYKENLEHQDTKLNFDALEESLANLEKKMYSTSIFKSFIKSTGAENIHKLREELKKQLGQEDNIEMLNTNISKPHP